VLCSSTPRRRNFVHRCAARLFPSRCTAVSVPGRRRFGVGDAAASGHDPQDMTATLLVLFTIVCGVVYCYGTVGPSACLLGWVRLPPNRSCRSVPFFMFACCFRSSYFFLMFRSWTLVGDPHARGRREARIARGGTSPQCHGHAVCGQC